MGWLPGTLHNNWNYGVLGIGSDDNFDSCGAFWAYYAKIGLVRVVNSIHFMQNGDENRVKIGSDKSIIFSKPIFVLFVALIKSLDQMHHLRPFAATSQNNKLLIVVEISQNHLGIFTENREHPTSNACNFLKRYFDACFKAQMVAFYQTRHLRLFSRPVRKKLKIL
jgi:hypothetical protein